MISYFLQLRPKFHFGGDFDFDDWNDWQQADGFLCRYDSDCQWVDRRLECDDREFNINSVTVRRCVSL